VGSPAPLGPLCLFKVREPLGRVMFPTGNGISDGKKEGGGEIVQEGEGIQLSKNPEGMKVVSKRNRGARTCLQLGKRK